MIIDDKTELSTLLENTYNNYHFNESIQEIDYHDSESYQITKLTLENPELAFVPFACRKPKS